jgi:ribosomal protein L15
MATKSKKKIVKSGKIAEPPKRFKDKATEKAVDKVKRLSCGLDESHKPFASRFLFSLIKEQDEAPVEASVEDVDGGDAKSPEGFTPEGDKQAFDQSLEPQTDPNQFETQGLPPEMTSDTINQIQEWSGKLNEFAEFLNDPTTNSLHKILADGDRAGSLLRGVTRKASDSITRIAGEVEKLKEILNTYIITAPKKMRDTEQLKAGG